VRVTSSALVLAVFASCGGERIRLGDGTMGGAHATNAGGAANHGGNGSTNGGFAGQLVGGTAGASCERGGTAANAVLWIGDSWVTIPGIQHTLVRDLARASGAIGPNDDYVIRAVPASTIDAITNQYTTYQAGTAKVGILIMDGGTWDTLTDDGSAASVTKAVDGFTQLLAIVASDGTVEHVIYYLPPELPTIHGVAALRPQLQRACADSSVRGVPCHFLDLQPLWVSNSDKYTAVDGIQASEAGATRIAEEIWGIMQENCIAQ